MAANPVSAIPQSSPDPFPDRETYIGGSEAHALLYQEQYGKGCARALGYEKTLTPVDVPHERQRQETSRAGLYKRGHLMEEINAQLLHEATGYSLMRRNRLTRHPRFPGAAVHTDRIIAATADKETGDCELKSHGEGPFLNIMRNGLPPGHNLQLQWSLFCTQHSWGIFSILGLFGELPLRFFEVERDVALMNIFADAVENFWNTIAAGDLPAQLSDPSDRRCKVCPFRLTCRGESLDREEYGRLMRDRDRKKPVVHVNNEELDQALADRALILSEIEALTHEDDEDPGALQLVTGRIRELLGDEDAVEVNNRWTVYQSPNSWSGVDVTRLKQEQPDIYERYYVKQRPSGTKRLRVYAVKKNPEAA